MAQGFCLEKKTLKGSSLGGAEARPNPGGPLGSQRNGHTDLKLMVPKQHRDPSPDFQAKPLRAFLLSPSFL